MERYKNDKRIIPNYSPIINFLIGILLFFALILKNGIEQNLGIIANTTCISLFAFLSIALPYLGSSKIYVNFNEKYIIIDNQILYRKDILYCQQYKKAYMENILIFKLLNGEKVLVKIPYNSINTSAFINTLNILKIKFIDTEMIESTSWERIGINPLILILGATILIESLLFELISPMFTNYEYIDDVGAWIIIATTVGFIVYHFYSKKKKSNIVKH